MCSPLQHTAAHCNTLQLTATHWNTLRHHICPVCDCSTEEEIDVSSCIFITNVLKCSQEFCFGKRTTFFFPCLCHNSCVEEHFASQKTGLEKCFCCQEPIENMYEMYMPLVGTTIVGEVE